MIRLYRWRDAWRWTRRVGAVSIAVPGVAVAQTVSISVTESNTARLHWPAMSSASGMPIEYRVEFSETLSTDGLSRTQWRPCPWEDQWPQQATVWVDERLLAPSRFYRVARLDSRGVVRTNWALGQGEYKVNEIQQYLNSIGMSAIQARNPVRTWAVIYETVTPDGLPTLASGAVFIPVSSNQVPLLSLQHGTTLLTNDVLSKWADGYKDVATAFAALGYCTAAPDFLGLGSGSGRHPYLHARSEATAAIDLLRATRTIASRSNMLLQTKIFLAGYSQGGHATMALHREIEANHTNEFDLVASAPMAGPYALWNTALPGIFQLQENRHYLLYVLFGYQSVYSLYGGVTDVLKEPYASNIPPLFNGQNDASRINAELPNPVAGVFQPAFLEALTNGTHRFADALKRNTLVNWRPRAPMRLFHSTADETVAFTNSAIATNVFHLNGATHVTLTNPAPAGANHADARLPCFNAARLWFEPMR